MLIGLDWASHVSQCYDRSNVEDAEQNHNYWRALQNTKLTRAVTAGSAGSRQMATFQEGEHTGVYCVGSGSDLTSRTTDRRSSLSSAPEHVATVWKALLEHIVDQESEG